MLCRTELPRAVRAGGDSAYLAQFVLRDLLQVPLTPDLLEAAGSLPGPLGSPASVIIRCRVAGSAAPGPAANSAALRTGPA
jgi:hypothetical protein